MTTPYCARNKKDFEKDLQIYVKLFTVLYADDRVLMAKSSEETFGVTK